jgi:hypothetical protein
MPTCGLRSALLQPVPCHTHSLAPCPHASLPSCSHWLTFLPTFSLLFALLTQPLPHTQVVKPGTWSYTVSYDGGKPVTGVKIAGQSGELDPRKLNQDVSTQFMGRPRGVDRTGLTAAWIS